jgi:hypothetical protein
LEVCENGARRAFKGGLKTNRAGEEKLYGAYAYGVKVEARMMAE